MKDNNAVMNSAVTLERVERLPEQGGELLRNYYIPVLPERGEHYADKRWEQLLQAVGLVFYRVVVNGAPAGFVVVNSTNSTVLEFHVGEARGVHTVETRVFDTLLEYHKLIAAELPTSDTDRYQFLTAFGFRPTGTFMLHGVPMMKMDLSSAVYLEKLPRMKKPPYQGREIVAIEKVTEPQSEGDIQESLRTVIERLGGLGKFVKPGQSVVIKPNLVSEHGLKDGVKRGGIVTDIRVVRAMVELLLPVAGTITIAEGASINRSETMKMFNHYGFAALQELSPEKVKLVDLNADECVEKNIPDGRRLQKRRIPKTLVEADVMINMPVLKLHFAAGASLSIKNLQGAIPPLEKYKVHFFGLWQNLINTYKVIMPDLIIVDGLFGQEDFGPVAGSPRKMDVLIGGTNPVAVDTVALKIMGLTVYESPPVLMAYHEGLGPVEWDHIEVKGPSLDELSCSFKRPVLNLTDGKCFKINDGGACLGCRGYLHFVLNKLRRPDPLHEGGQLIDRPFKKDITVCIGPYSGESVEPGESTVFMGMCQQHHAEGGGTYLPGCPPHAEEIINGIFQFYKDVERPQYADQTEEGKLRDLLKSVLEC